MDGLFDFAFSLGVVGLIILIIAFTQYSKRQNLPEAVKHREEVMELERQEEQDQMLFALKEEYRQYGMPLPLEYEERYKEALRRKAKQTFLLFNEEEIDQMYK